ncbi:MAG: phosphoribosylamine--glycine ligase [Planctomycetes bacterium]|nr:phosphoribosylamine--glycine ligase [Planctomycetota bacterium]
MDVLVIGGGGREHALVWKIKQSPLVEKIYCAPGNAGIATLAECVDISAEDTDGLLEFASKNNIGLTVVGPEQPLLAGIADKFIGRGLKIFGPTKLAANLEGSKSFCKNLLKQYAVPTANYRVFDSHVQAQEYVRNGKLPVVIKADGLASGKGVKICKSRDEAESALKEIMEDKVFGAAGNSVVVEEFLEGDELSVMAITDGKTIMVLEGAQDHKRAFNEDKGPNTGGMGAYSPVPFLNDKLYARIEKEILVPVVHAMKKERMPFKGLLYAGIMLCKPAPKVLEFNVRFGDPETQPVMMRMKSDIVPIMLATINGTLEEQEIAWDERGSVCVVMASGGYPDKYDKGFEITGLEEAGKMQDTVVFHAGTKTENGKCVTSGGRVLGVTTLGKDIKSARMSVYKAIGKINFEKAHYRTDIGSKAMTSRL